MNSKYQIEVWQNGALVLRTEESDCVVKTVRSALVMYKALGITFTVFVLRDDKQYMHYEWSSLV